MPNIKRLKALLEYVERLPPERIVMRNYRCGTAACLLGHAVAVFPDEMEWIGEFPGVKGLSAEEFFGVDTQGWLDLFSARIPNHKAVQNLREYISRWEV